MHRRLHLPQLILVVALFSLARTAHAKSHQLVMSFDTHPSDAPQFVCVVTSMRSCPKDALEGGKLKKGAVCDTYELSALQDLGILGSWGDRSAEFTAVDLTNPERVVIKDKFKALSNALDELVKPVSDRCAGKHGSCRPSVHLAKYRDTKLKTPTEEQKKKDIGRIICGEDPANRNGLVAILSLSYHEEATSSSIERVAVDGTHATLILKEELDEKNFSISQVLGGDYEYTPQSAVGTRERVEIELVRRCKLVQVQLPRHVSQLDTDKVVIDRLRPLDDQKRGQQQKETVEVASCVASIREGVFAIQIPYVSAPGLKTLHIGTTPRFEATWTEPTPDLPLHFAHRSFEFHWRRDCVLDKWPEAPPPGASWNQRCPRALVDGSTCSLAVSSDPEHTCSYRCEVADTDYPLALPAAVRFERVRAAYLKASSAVEEILYGWNDVITASGQTLISSAPASDRKLVIDTPSPSNWQPYGGDIVETIRVVYADGTTADVRPSDRQWTSVRAPENACSGNVRVAVLGTRRYDEENRDTPGGILKLDSPKDFRSLLHGYVVLGTAAQLSTGRDTFQPIRVEPMGTIGGSMEIYWPSRTLSVTLNLLAHVSKLAYGELHGLGEREPTYDHVWFTRIEGSAGLVWWMGPRFHLGFSFGYGRGFPTRSSDRDRTGAIGYGLIETFLRIRWGVTQRWGEIALGLRINEERRFWETDFTGEPTATTRELTTPYLAGRLRL